PSDERPLASATRAERTTTRWPHRTWCRARTAPRRPCRTGCARPAASTGSAPCCRSRASPRKRAAARADAPPAAVEFLFHPSQRAVVWLFPGQGTQKVGMGRALWESSPAARAVFEAADDALGEPFSKLIFEGPADDLTQTANAQPAILTASIAALAALREAHPDVPAPSFAAGHSLGEYSALVAAGVLDL